MNKIILALLTFSISLSAIARIGESRIECIKRYGPEENDDTHLFNPNFSLPVTFSKHNVKDIVVTLWYLDGKSICIQYLRMPSKKSKDCEWKKAEIDHLLKVNSGKTDWEKLNDDVWMTKERQFAAYKDDLHFNPELFGGASDGKQQSLSSSLTVLYSKYSDKVRSDETMKTQDALSDF